MAEFREFSAAFRPFRAEDWLISEIQTGHPVDFADEFGFVSQFALLVHTPLFLNASDERNNNVFCVHCADPALMEPERAEAC